MRVHSLRFVDVERLWICCGQSWGGDYFGAVLEVIAGADFVEEVPVTRASVG